MSPKDTPTPSDRDDRAMEVDAVVVAVAVVLAAPKAAGIGNCFAPYKEGEDDDCLRRCLSLMLDSTSSSSRLRRY
jgi:hypothetical protein